MFKQGRILITFSVSMYTCKQINQINERSSTVVNHLNGFVLNISVDIQFTCLRVFFQMIYHKFKLFIFY